jgi:hypothetical protein
LDAGFLNQRLNFVKVDSNNKVTDSLTYVFNSISFPIKAGIWTRNGRFFVTAGFGASYVLTGMANHPGESVDISSEIAKFNFYAQFGGGFLISLGRPYLQMELNYSQGLRDLNSSVFHDQGYLPRTKLTGLNFTASIHLPLGASGHYKILK